jgi:hypothetical protein
MRAAYKKASQYLVTIRPKNDEFTKQMKNLRELILIGRRVSPAEIQKHDLENMTNEEFNKILESRDIPTDAKLENQGFQRNGGTSQGRHRDIPISQLSVCLTQGCRYVEKFTDESGQQKAIIEIPF